MKFHTVIVDGDNLAWKCFYAMPNLSHEGRPTGAIFGTVKALLSYYKRFDPEFLIVTWTGPNNFRKEIYPEYKAKRKEKDSNYFEQQHIIERLLSAMGINQAKVPGFEADDIIAEVAFDSSIKQGKTTLIISNDKDLLQLVSQRTIVLKGDKLYNDSIVHQEYGCYPHDIPLWLAIVGDKSDNIQGVPQVGPKKTAGLFYDYGKYTKSVIFDDNEPIPKHLLMEKVRHFRKQLDINLKIIELKSGRITPDENIINKKIDKDKVVKIIQAHGMESLLVPVLEWMDGRTFI